MGATETAATKLTEARAAAGGRAWNRAYELFSIVAAERRLEPEDLEVFAKAAYWTGYSNESISILETAYAAYIEQGDDQRAAFCALTLRRQYISKQQDSPAAGVAVAG